MKVNEILDKISDCFLFIKEKSKQDKPDENAIRVKEIEYKHYVGRYASQKDKEDNERNT